KAPFNIPGMKVDVTVINKDGGVAQEPDAIEYIEPTSDPRIDEIIPSQGPAAGGNVVTIRGSGFGTSENAKVVVYFGGKLAEFKTDENGEPLVSHDSLEVIAPRGDPGVVKVIVSNIEIVEKNESEEGDEDDTE